MKTVYGNTILVNKQTMDAVVDGEYLGDFYQDDKCILEEMDSLEYLLTEESANDDIWDVMNLNEEDIGEMSGWLIY